MIFFLIFLVFIALVFITCYVINVIIIPHRSKKHLNFVLEHSHAIHKVEQINKRFSFSSIETMDEEHTYDNEKMYENISCQDYLIYQLQFKSKSILKQFENAKKNAQLYDEYCTEVYSECRLGEFDCDTTKLNLKKILLIEKEEFERRLKHSTIAFRINITLKLSSLRGFIYDRKSCNFDERTVTSLVKRLQNKNGSFYLDRSIWDAICRVERGRVSNKMRFSIMERDGYRCCHCGKRETDENLLEIDHIIPISKGGKSVYDNLQTLCHKCNVEKGNRF